MNDKRYKYWLYYEKDSNELYAYTDQKELMEEFDIHRDLQQFHKVTKKISRDEVNFLAKDYQGLYLVKKSLLTYNKKTDEMVSVPMLLTMNEYMITSASIVNILNNLSALCWYDLEIFREEIQDALHVLRYDDFHSLAYHEICIDELNIFLSIYGSVMK